MDMDLQRDVAAAREAGLTLKEYYHRRGQAAKQRCMAPVNAFKQDRTEKPKALPKPVKLPQVPFTIPEAVDPLIGIVCENKELKQTIYELRRQHQKKYMPLYQEWLEQQKAEDAKRPTMLMILHQTCERWGVTVEQMRSPSRVKFLSTARMEFCYRAHTEGGYGWKPMGRMINKDHTSALHGVTRYKKLMKMKASGAAPAGCLRDFWHLILDLGYLSNG